MKLSTIIENLVKLRKVFGEVCLAAIAYGTIKLHPLLVPQAVGLALVGTLFASSWVLLRTKAKFHQSPVLIRKPILSLASAVACYGALQFTIDYFDYHTPPAPLASLADLLIQLLFALTFSFLALSACSLLRNLGIDPIEYLQKLKAGEPNGE
jgi:hypothetical protein